MTAATNDNQSFSGVWSELERLEDGIYCQQTEFGETYIPTHKHSKGQLMYAEGGRVYIAAHNKVWYLPARHYIWIPAGVEHSLKITLASAQVWNIYFPVWEDDSAFYQQVGIYPVNNMLLEQLYFIRGCNGIVTREHKARYYFLSGIKAILPEISKSNLRFDLPQPKEPRLEEVVTYIQNNLSESISVSTVAKKFGMSESTLTRLFRKDLRMSFINYVGTLRILRSVELLATGVMNIKEICYEVGYESVPTFSNVFKKSVGVRPTSYLKAS